LKREKDLVVDNLIVRQEPEPPDWRRQLGAFNHEQSTRARTFQKGLRMQGRATAQQVQGMLFTWLGDKFDTNHQQLSESSTSAYNILTKLNQRGQFKGIDLGELRDHLPPAEPPPRTGAEELTPDQYQQLLDKYHDTLVQKGETTLNSQDLTQLLRHPSNKYRLIPQEIDSQADGPRLDLHVEGNPKPSVFIKKTKIPIAIDVNGNQVTIELEGVQAHYARRTSEDLSDWFEQQYTSLIDELGIKPYQIRLTDKGQLRIISGEKAQQEAQAALEKAAQAQAQAKAKNQTPSDSATARVKARREATGPQPGDVTTPNKEKSGPGGVKRTQKPEKKAPQTSRQTPIEDDAAAAAKQRKLEDEQARQEELKRRQRLSAQEEQRKKRT
jgi:hypothetical protein